MLYLIVYYLLITFVSLWSGFVFYGCLGLLNGARLTPRSWIVYVLSGFISCALFAQVAVLFIPLKLPSFLLYLTLMAFLGIICYRWMPEPFHMFLKRLSRAKHPRKLLLVIPFIIFIMLINSGAVLMDDTDSYHIQMIKWIQEYGTVPGIANLHVRYGLNSSWFVTAGFLLQPFFGITPYLALNGLLSVWAGSYLLNKIYIVYTRKPDEKKTSVLAASFVLFCLMIFCWPMIRGNPATANYDFITTFIIVVIFLESYEANKLTLFPELLIWPCFLFTVRIINYPWLLLSLLVLVYLYRIRQNKLATICLFSALLIVIPFLARNIYLSGYVFYPLHQLDLFNTDWKADDRIMSAYVEFTRTFNRVNEMHLPIEETRRIPFPEWITFWYKYLSYFDKLLIIIAGASMIFMIFWKRKLKEQPALQVIITIAMFHLLSWFIVSPDPRFAYGPLLVLIAAATICLINEKFVGMVTRTLKISIALVVISLVGFGFSKALKDERYRNLAIPLKLPEPPLKKIVIDGIEFFIPEKIPGNWNPRCFNTTLPCLYELDPRLRPRGNKIQAGFTIHHSNTLTK